MADWKAVVAAVAPGIATALGGPLAGTVIAALSGELLGRNDGTEAEIARAIAPATPEILEKISNAERSFRLDMERLNIDFERLAAADRDSARNLARATGIAPQIWLSGLFIAGYFVLVALLLAKEIEIAESLRDVFQVLIGVTTASVATILNFWFGTSRSSQAKDEAIQRALTPGDSRHGT